MKDIGKNVVVGVLVAIFTAAITWAVTEQKEPHVEVLLNRPFQAIGERLTVFRVRNAGGASATGIEIMFDKSVNGRLWNTSAITEPNVHNDTIFGALRLVIPKLKPSEEVFYYLSENAPTIADARRLVDRATFDQGVVLISTEDARFNTYLWQQKIDFGIVAFCGGFGLCGIMCAIGTIRDKMKKKTVGATAHNPLSVT